MADIEERAHQYLCRLSETVRATPIEIGGMPDHIHVLALLPASLSVSDFAKRIKGSSSRWIKESFPDRLGFSWQDGFSAFNVSKSQMGRVQKYIASQCEHHKHMTYQEEYLLLLKQHSITYDEEHLWD
jgi:REP element-mobilizing transposase RayT